MTASLTDHLMIDPRSKKAEKEKTMTNLTDEEKHTELLQLMEKAKAKKRIIRKQESKIRSIEKKISILLDTEERDDERET